MIVRIDSTVLYAVVWLANLSTVHSIVCKRNHHRYQLHFTMEGSFHFLVPVGFW